MKQKFNKKLFWETIKEVTKQIMFTLLAFTVAAALLTSIFSRINVEIGWIWNPLQAANSPHGLFGQTPSVWKLVTADIITAMYGTFRLGRLIYTGITGFYDLFWEEEIE